MSVPKQVDQFARENVNHFLLPYYLQLGGSGSNETQILVSPNGGEPVAGQRGCYSDGVHKWWNIRLPKSAGKESNHLALPWPIVDHASHFGWSGWSYAEMKSYAVGYDFDSIVGHAKGVGITDQQLAEVKATLQSVPWAHVVRSTGGRGLHVWVLLPGVATEDRAAHAALARAVLGMLSAACNFNFAADVDCFGQLLWLWSSTQAPNAYESLQVGRALTEAEIPSNWRDNLPVVKRERSKVRPQGVADSDEELFGMLTSSNIAIALDPIHNQILDELRATGATTNWVPDHWLVQSHSVAFKQVFDKLGLKGFYDTTSEGNDLACCNCFAFPRLNGAWRIYRFGRHVSEAGNWSISNDGWTYCDYNVSPDFKVAARALGGIEAPNGSYEFATAKIAIDACAALGQEIILPETLQQRTTTLSVGKGGRLIVQVKRDDGDSAPQGWLSQPKSFTRIYDKEVATRHKDDRAWDSIVRSLETPQGKPAGWGIRRTSGKWKLASKDDAKSVLMGQGMGSQEANAILGQIYTNSWTKVQIPFADEWPASRQWNVDAARLLHEPSATPGPHKHWDKILSHVGSSLDAPLKVHPWAQQYHIATGADYLTLWIASAIRFPFEPLPFLAIVGRENAGKSVLHEALSLIVSSTGIVRADEPLKDRDQFNGTMAPAVFCIIEETDLGQKQSTKNRVKDWTTSRVVSIRAMRTERFEQPNTWHFIQCANDVSHVPLWSSDTRVMLLQVDAIEDEIPKPALLEELTREAPYFLRTIYDVLIPPADGRLRLPLIATEEKRQAIFDGEPVAEFLAKRCEQGDDFKVGKADLFNAWSAWCADNDIDDVGTRHSLTLQLKRLSHGKITNRAKLPKEEGRGEAYGGVRLIEPSKSETDQLKEAA